MRAVISVIGKDTVGILAAVSTKCSEFNINVIEVTQSGYVCNGYDDRYISNQRRFLKIR